MNAYRIVYQSRDAIAMSGFQLSGPRQHLQQPRTRDDGQGNPVHAVRRNADRKGGPGD